MGRKANQMKQVRRRHSPEFRKEALELANKLGVSQAAKQLGIYESQIYSWRGKRRLEMSSSEAESLQAAEIARLKRQLAERDEEVAILKKAAAYFAKHHK